MMRQRGRIAFALHADAVGCDGRSEASCAPGHRKAADALYRAGLRMIPTGDRLDRIALAYHAAFCGPGHDAPDQLDREDAAALIQQGITIWPDHDAKLEGDSCSVCGQEVIVALLHAGDVHTVDR